jgi:hypothetical protein
MGFRNELNRSTEVVNVDDFADCSGAVAGGGAAVVALQQVVGLLPERRPGFGCGGSAGAASSGAALVIFREADAFVTWRIGGSIGSHPFLTVMHRQFFPCRMRTVA